MKFEEELLELAKKFGDNYTYGQIVKTLNDKFILKQKVEEVIEKELFGYDNKKMDKIKKELGLE